MKIFISSTIVGMEEYRAAARAAAEVLRHQVIVAEDFGASAATPQQACLAGIRQADLVVLLFGSRYGTTQQSGLSATHEEYREARGRHPVLAFIGSTTPEPEQASFIEEVRGWEGGNFTVPFDTPASLAAAVTRALHEWELAQQVGPVDEDELVTRAVVLLPTDRSGFGESGSLHLATAGGPRQQLLRPRQLEAAALHRDISREALFGEHPIFASTEGVADPKIVGDTLLIAQPHAQVTLDESGSVRVSLPARTKPGLHEVPSLIEEDVRDRIAAAIRFTGWLLDQVDPTHRLSKVAIGARLKSSGGLAWRTRAEAAASSQSASMGFGHRGDSVDSPPTVLPRAALLLNTATQADDIVVRLGRQMRS